MALPQPDDDHEVVRVRDGGFVFIMYSLSMAFHIAIPLEDAFKSWVVSVGLGIAGGCAFTLILTGAVLWGEPPPPTLRGKVEWFFTALTKSPRGKLDTCSEWGQPRHYGGDEEEAAPENRRTTDVRRKIQSAPESDVSCVRQFNENGLTPLEWVFAYESNAHEQLDLFDYRITPLERVIDDEMKNRNRRS